MNRIIKFRAILNQEALSSGRYEHTSRFQEFTLEDVIRGKFTLVYPEHWKIVRFTGLKDKNGKEIYEGSIIKWGHLRDISRENPVRIAVVEINPDIQFRTINPEFKHTFKFGSFAYADTFSEDVEEIGNIYQNPELLKK